MTELSAAMSALQTGNFNREINRNAQGEYGVMLASAAQAMQAFNQVITDIVNVMHRMSEGDFNHRVQANAQGDLLMMKNNINDSISAILFVTKLVTQLIFTSLLYFIQSVLKPKTKSLYACSSSKLKISGANISPPMALKTTEFLVSVFKNFSIGINLSVIVSMPILFS
jgi:hypothetical protein